MDTCFCKISCSSSVQTGSWTELNWTLVTLAHANVHAAHGSDNNLKLPAHTVSREILQHIVYTSRNKQTLWITCWWVNSAKGTLREFGYYNRHRHTILGYTRAATWTCPWWLDSCYHTGTDAKLSAAGFGSRTVMSYKAGYKRRPPNLHISALEHTTERIPIDWSHLRLITHDQRLLRPLGCPQLFPLWNQKLSNVLGWRRSVARKATHTYATSVTNPEEVSWNANHYVPSNCIQLLEKDCLRITATMCSRHHQSQLSHRIHKLLRNPHPHILLIPPQEWRIFNTILPFRFSVLFLFFSLYFYQDYCFCLGLYYSRLCSRAHFTSLFKLL